VLLPVIMEIADMVSTAVVSVTQIDRDGARPSTMRAFCGALRSVATTDLREPGGLAPVA
jgi:hypothetical protein